MSLESSILTYVRIRPSKGESVVTADKENGTLYFSKNASNQYVDNTKTYQKFTFNGVLDMSIKQDEVFKRVGVSAVQNALDGFNSTIFAYGQTGSGKTFTLTGSDVYVDRGIIPRAISMVFNEVREKSGNFQFEVFVSYLEIYNEEGFDLLYKKKELKKVVKREDANGNCILGNLTVNVCATEEAAISLLVKGDENRHIAATEMNKESSRSHCIFTIMIQATEYGSNIIRKSKLNLVDLAGSERLNKSQSKGDQLTEAKNINKSLFNLKFVIMALNEKASKGRQHIPYRDSFMTYVLRDSLGGNCRTVMIATIAPLPEHAEESMQTCQFAQQVSLVKNAAVVNEEERLEDQVKRLKDELEAARSEALYLKGESGEGEALSADEVDDLREQCRLYCDDLDPRSVLNIGALTLTKIKDTFAILKNLVLESRANQSGGAGDGNYNSAGGGDNPNIMSFYNNTSNNNTMTGSGSGGETTTWKTKIPDKPSAEVVLQKLQAKKKLEREHAQMVDNVTRQVGELKSKVLQYETELELNNKQLKDQKTALSAEKLKVKDLLRKLLDYKNNTTEPETQFKKNTTLSKTATLDNNTSSKSNRNTNNNTISSSSTRPPVLSEMRDPRATTKKGVTKYEPDRSTSSTINDNDSDSNSDNDDDNTQTITPPPVAAPQVKRTAPPAMPTQEQMKQSRERAVGEKLIARHLFGVPPPTDPEVFEDAQASFDYFSSLSDLRLPVEANKATLREKITEAKQTGERANQSRNRIMYLKSKIEAIRREIALANYTSRGRDEEEGEEVVTVVSAEEKECRSEMEDMKSAYHDNFNRLSALKAEIEHVTKMLQSSKEKLQAQFDTWFDNLHSKSGDTLLQQAQSQAQSQVQSQGVSQQYQHLSRPK